MATADQTAIHSLRQALTRFGGQPAVPAEPAVPTLATGWPAVDRLLGGGLPAGRLTEVVGARSSGKASFAFAAAANAMASPGQLVAWIDAPGELYPPAAAASGVVLDRLMIVRPGSAQDAAGLVLARAGEIVARSRAFSLLVLDLPLGGRLIERAATRLRAAAHEAGLPVVVLGDRRGAVPHAHCQLESRSRQEAGQRRIELTLHRGGAGAPGETAGHALAAPGLADFRPAAQARELARVADAIRPVRLPPRRMPR
jgi:hypothetical protein